MKLAIIFPTLNQHDLAKTAIDFAANNVLADTEVIVLDNGSDTPFDYGTKRLAVSQQSLSIAQHEDTPLSVQPPEMKTVEIKTIRLNKNIGVYPTFWEALKHTDADILAFFHTDLIIAEKGWDERVLMSFEINPNLGLIGFVGSNEIDSSGGRGVGTTSNFQGTTSLRRLANGEDKQWVGSRAEAHGMRNEGLTKAAVVDGCAMIFRRTVLEKIKQRADFPIHHFYDRLLSCETREAGFEVAVLGIGCDHISGQTVNQEDAYGKSAQQWAEAHGLEREGNENWDQVIYREAERQWLEEYRDIKHLVPIKV